MVKRNHFTNKFLTKSDQELNDILESPHHVDKAKLAAKWILEERKRQTGNQSTKKVVNENKPRILQNNQDSKRKRYNEWRMLALGITFIIAAFYINFDNLFVTQNSLIELKGTVKSSDVIIETVSTTNRLGFKNKSQKATLHFSLKEHNKSFKLFENIGQSSSHREYNSISKSLLNSRKVTVWVSLRGLDNFDPKAFQIGVNGGIILDYETISSDNTGIFFFLMLIGFGMTGFALYSKYPNKIRKTLRMSEASDIED